MAAVTLTEQMGAMSLIDELRHKQMLVQEHLNLHERRKEIARRLRDFYSAKGAVVDDALVDRGVREYFDRRLTFDAPKIGKVATVAARLFTTRAQWGKTAAIVIAVVVIACGIAAKGLSLHDASKTADVQIMVERMSVRTVRLQEEIAHQEAGIAAINRQLVERPLPPVPRMMHGVSDKLTEARRLLVLSPNSPVTQESRDAVLAASVGYQRDLQEVSTILDGTSEKIESSVRLIGARNLFRETIKGDTFIAAKLRYPVLKTAEASALKAILSADVNGSQAASVAVQKLVGMVNDSIEIAAIADQKTDLLARFKAMDLDQAGKDRVASLESKAVAAIAAISANEAAAAINELSAVAAYAEVALTFNVVDRGGVKSGVERKEKTSSGKSWFLIIEAINPAGVVVNVPVISNETGIKKDVGMFGVRVSQAEYERVKADKKADGHVDNRLIGKKPANSLTIEFNDRTSQTPDMILEW